MLIRFTVENFLSFNKRVDFNMIASNDTHHSHHIVGGDSEESIKLLRSSIIYGANASGKSNLIKAMKFAKDFIVNGVEKNKNINIDNFRLDKTCFHKPSRFEFEFRYQNKQYAYGFLIDKHKVHEEWLFEMGLNLENPIYERTRKKINFNFENELFLNISEYDKNRLAYEADGTRENLLFLTNSQERDIKQFENIYTWFDDVLTIIFPNSKPLLLPLVIQVETDSWSDILKSFDLGIKSIKITQTPLDDYSEIEETIKNKIEEDFPQEAVTMFVPHLRCVISKAKDGTDRLIVSNLSTVRIDKDDSEVIFKISEESDGTQRLIDLVPMLINLDQGNAVFVIDEIERSLHSLLIKKLFDLFLNSPKNTNLNSQLIASTHEVNLLDIKELFRKDEIWFVEKDKDGQSILYSLANTDVENLDLATGYLNGRFGAIPFIKDLKASGWSKEK
ncbi:MAG: ATP-binding protein [Nostocales cyanobacterium]|nr:MAG: ATP-binding protein [Nostocales cyanobacterium]